MKHQSEQSSQSVAKQGKSPEEQAKNFPTDKWIENVYLVLALKHKAAINELELVIKTLEDRTCHLTAMLCDIHSSNAEVALMDIKQETRILAALNEEINKANRRLKEVDEHLQKTKHNIAPIIEYLEIRNSQD